MISEKKILLVSSLFGNTYRCEQVFSLIKNVKSWTKTRHTDEHVEERMLIAVRSIKTHIESKSTFK
jgi:hypothetical protein